MRALAGGRDPARGARVPAALVSPQQETGPNLGLARTGSPLMKLIITRDRIIPPAPDHLYGILEAGLLILQTMERPWVPEHGGGTRAGPMGFSAPARPSP